MQALLKSLVFVGIIMLAAAASCKRHFIPDLTGLEEDTPLIWKDSLASDKDKDREKRANRVKATPKRMFYGKMTRKAFTKLKRNRVTTYELFYVLRDTQTTAPYVTEIYWFHKKKRKIMVGAIPEADKPFAKILHGPYQRTVNNIVAEEGVFYFGAKHARWERYTVDETHLLEEKRKYYKGFSKESAISFWDAEKTKMREVIPVENEQLHGKYYYFTQDGLLLIDGQYDTGKKIGNWREMHTTGTKGPKNVFVYPKNAAAPSANPWLYKTYSDRGKTLYSDAGDSASRKWEGLDTYPSRKIDVGGTKKSVNLYP